MSLATQGQVIGFLKFVTQGQAEDTSTGRTVGHLQAPCAIEEITCFDGGPASATVIAEGTGPGVFAR